MTTTPAPLPALPASSLHDLFNRKVVPFDQPFWLTEVDGTALNPPMLVEGVDLMSLIEGASPSILLSVWPADRRSHVMHGILVDADAKLTFTFHRPEPA